jgi:drug/metabolite transporter (DMT)-like permease
MTARTILLLAAALVGFAGNSLLCRLALAEGAIDAASFTAVRLVTGAMMLSAIAFVRSRPATFPGDVRSAAALFAYAAPFSFAYLRLGAGVGALVLFAAVQAVMIGTAIVRGERPSLRVFVGLAVALGGLVVLTLPGASAPDPLGAAGMAVAGIAWAIYSLRGRTAGTPPLVTTAGNFVRSVPMAAVGIALAAALIELRASPRGLALAAASGMLASGVGYSLWYAVLPQLSATAAAIVQLLVPIVAALGGVVLLGEVLDARLAAATVAIVGGVALAVTRSRG